MYTWNLVLNLNGHKCVSRTYTKLVFESHKCLTGASRKQEPRSEKHSCALFGNWTKGIRHEKFPLVCVCVCVCVSSCMYQSEKHHSYNSPQRSYSHALLFFFWLQQEEAKLQVDAVSGCKLRKRVCVASPRP